ncbi:myosin heavy chain IB-like isoform X1 [Canis lupus familiaris]|uniref:myosin heavy chain IB-like isoform X1 n=1 Tax=Canis lupus familiaris TaxID=9615 RepID=UPI0018F3A7E9|nr:myosin heavy chain IB-like isoform X1 [Canis lupus familiaris]
MARRRAERGGGAGARGAAGAGGGCCCSPARPLARPPLRASPSASPAPRTYELRAAGRAAPGAQRKARRGVGGAARPGAPGRGTWEPPRRAPAISARPERAARGWPRVESAGNGARGSGPPNVDYLVCISRAQTTPTPATSSASWACFLPPGSRGAYLAAITQRQHHGWILDLRKRLNLQKSAKRMSLRAAATGPRSTSRAS